jgi:hypothetical protein
MTWALAFVAMIGVDIAWAKYVLAASDRRAFHAATWSASIVCGGALVTLLYVSSPWNLVPAALGAFAGTYWTVRRG